MFLVEHAAFYLYKCDISRHATDMGFKTSGRFFEPGFIMDLYARYLNEIYLHFVINIEVINVTKI